MRTCGHADMPRCRDAEPRRTGEAGLCISKDAKPMTKATAKRDFEERELCNKRVARWLLEGGHDGNEGGDGGGARVRASGAEKCGPDS
jgi:hypothetical protein